MVLEGLLGGEWSPLWLGAALALLVLWLGSALRPGSTRRKRLDALVSRIPGPLCLPFIGSAYAFFVMPREGIFKYFDFNTRKYWPIFKTRNGPIVQVHLSEPDYIEVILRSSVNINKGHIYKFLHPWLGTGLLTSTGQKWFSHRKMLTPTFHFKILESFQEVFAERSLEMVQHLEKEVSNKQGFDVYPYITLCALDIICDTAMGTDVNAQQNKKSPYVDAIYQASELTTIRMFKPWLHPDFLYYLTKDGKKYKKCIDILHSFADTVIRERKETLPQQLAAAKDESEGDTLGKKKRKAFLDLLLEANQEKIQLTDEEIREEVDTFMFEGHDTTSASLCWTLFLLGHHPQVQDQVYEEQKAIFGDSDRLPTMQDLSEMKYLEMVIKESLRLYPSVPFIMRTLTEEVTVGEYTLPVGISAVVHIYHIHRNPKYFPDPEKFNPDNFLPEKVQGRHPYAYVPFSAGSRNCIGQKFALLEEKTVLSTVMRRFRVRSLEKPEDITLVSELVLRPVNGIRLAIERR